MRSATGHHIRELVAGALARLTDGPVHVAATLLFRLALLVWSAEEIASDVNWFCRLRGVAGASYAVVAMEPGLASRFPGGAWLSVTPAGA